MPASLQRRLLFLIESDPRTSHRPAEAIRIAAGIIVWKQVAVDICLTGPATLILSDSTDDLVDAEEIHRCLPLLLENGCIPRVENDNPPPSSVNNWPAIDRASLAALAAECDNTLRF